MCLHLRTGSYFILNSSSFLDLLTMPLLLPPPIFQLLPPQSICVQSLRQKDNFLLILEQGEAGSPTQQEYKSETWQEDLAPGSGKPEKSQERKKSIVSVFCIGLQNDQVSGVAVCFPLCRAPIFPLPMTSSMT